MFKKIMDELTHHAPFTIIGALAGIFLIFPFRLIPSSLSYRVFYILHPMHVFLSALVTASLFKLHTCPKGEGKRCNLPILFIVGFIGSIGIATLSDSLIPYLGETILDLPYRESHIGFIEEWWIINPAAILGISVAYFFPSTKAPHAGHVLISTFASIFHILMAIGTVVSIGVYMGIFVFLFLSVWVPCCVSDIVFPLLFIRPDKDQ